MRISSSSVIKNYEINSNDKNREITDKLIKKNTHLDINDEIREYRKNEFKYAEFVKDSKEIYKKYFEKDSFRNLMNIEKYFDTTDIVMNELFDNKKMDVISKNYLDNLISKIEDDGFNEILEVSDIDILQSFNDGELFINKENDYKKTVLNKNIDLNKESLKIASSSDKLIENNSYIRDSIDSTELAQNMQKFVSEYNSLIDKVKSILSEQKSQKKVNVKKGLDDESMRIILEMRRNQENNEKNLKKFIEEIQNALFSTVNEINNKLSEVGIKPSKEDTGIRLEFDEYKYKKAIEENGRGMYKLLIGFDEDEGQSPIRQLKDIFKRFSNSQDSLFAKGINTQKQKNYKINEEDIRKQEEDIKALIKRMEEKENELGNKFSLLQIDLNKYDKQIDKFNY